MEMQQLRFVISVSLLVLLSSNAQTETETNSSSSSRIRLFPVGVILERDSLVGRIGLTSLSLALSDFYTTNANANYTTRLVLHVRDSTPRLTSAALSLINDVEVDAIIGPQKSSQVALVVDLGDAARVPVISFSATSPSLHPPSPLFLQTAQSDAAQVDALAAIVNYFQWHEDSDYGHGIIPYLSNALQQLSARVAYRSVIPVSASDDAILRELYKLKTMQTPVFLVHASSSFASKLFPRVKEAEMMTEGYAWIVTSGLMDLFHSLHPKVVDTMKNLCISN